MGERVLYLFMVRGKNSWHEMPEDEQKRIAAEVRESLVRVGGKTIVSASCEWSNPRYQMFGVQEFPSIAALQQHFEDQREAGALEHIEGDYIVGVPPKDD